jgi:hypothetical protein
MVNARDVKHLPGRQKTDRLDAVWLARPGQVPQQPVSDIFPGVGAGDASPYRAIDLLLAVLLIGMLGTYAVTGGRFVRQRCDVPAWAATL